MSVPSVDLPPPGPETDLEVARIVTPAFAGIGYGLYAFTKYGAELAEGLRTYVAVVGGLAAVIGAIAAFGLGRFSGLFALGGFAAWLYAIYMFGFLGLYGGYLGISDGFKGLSVAGSVVWIILGWHMLNKLTAAVDRRSRIRP